MTRIDSEKLSTKCRIHCCSIVRTSILYMHASQNDNATNTEPRKANTMSKHTKTRHALGWIYRGWLLRKIKGHTGGTGWIVGGKIADSGQVDYSASRAVFGSSAEAETLAELVENVDAICNQQQAREAIAATEAKLGKGHELTCQRAIHALGWDQDGEQAAELVRIYQGRA